MKLGKVISPSQIDRKTLEELFEEAEKISKQEWSRTCPPTLNCKVMASLFYEPSTRTRFSFEAAMLKLGGKVISTENARLSSSAVKGESLEDTIRMVSGYADLIVLRHPQNGAAEIAAKVSSVPIVNAGDGGNEHPTQAMLDMYTIKKEKGRLNNLHVALACDPKHSRTIRSLALLLGLYEGNRLTFISPDSLRADPEFLKKLSERGIPFEEASELKAGLDADVLYINRLQQERFADPAEFEKNRKLLVLKADMLKGKQVTVLDPLPRIDEIATDVDALPNAAYFRQAQNGLYVRMALLQTLLSP